MIRWLPFALTCWGLSVSAAELAPSAGTEIARDDIAGGSVRLPRMAWQPGIAFEETKGAVRRRAFQTPNPTLTTLQLSEPLRSALLDSGYTEVFGCADQACGGFDFRFQLDLLPPPAMYVDLGDYRYLLMEKSGAEPRLVSIVTSKSVTSGYVHITEIFEIASFQGTDAPEESPVPASSSDDLGASLIDIGHVVLDDLEFATGSAELGTGPFSSLRSLADWLAKNPGARVVLVGHTDSIGSLEANLTLSRRRASSVLDRLVEELGVASSQVTSDGAGALSPIAPNLSDQGRALNRRVEVVLLRIE